MLSDPIIEIETVFESVELHIIIVSVSDNEYVKESVLVKVELFQNDSVNVLDRLKVLSFVNMLDPINAFDSENVFDCVNIFENVLDCVNVLSKVNVRVGGRHSSIVVPCCIQWPKTHAAV